MYQTSSTLQSYLDCETVQSMKETLGESFAHLAHFHFCCPDEGDTDAYDTILSSLIDFHHVLILAQKGART